MKYTDIHVGDKETLTHTITREDIGKFVELTGDNNKLHVDEKFASLTNFKKPVVHGMLGASFISTVIGTKLPGDGALWFSQTLEFLLPVRIGDVLLVVAQVIKKYDKENIIELKTEITNQNKQVVTRGIAKVKVIEQEMPAGEIEKKPETRKSALVIGATGGIGSAVCTQLAKDGFDIVIHYKSNKAKAEEIKTSVEETGQTALLVCADVLDESDIRNMVEASLRAYGKIDVLVNCSAMVIPNIKFLDLEWSDFSKQMDFYIRAAFLIIKAVIPSMVEQGAGKIINIGSLANDKPNSEWAHYITAKSALAGLTRSLAFELAPKGIKVNMVSPGMVRTELTADIPEKIKLLTASQTPLRRLALASDVAGVISFLASDKADFLAGENIRVNGGQFMI